MDQGQDVSGKTALGGIALLALVVGGRLMIGFSPARVEALLRR